MGGQPSSLEIAEWTLLGLLGAVGVVLTGSWLLGRIDRRKGDREQHPAEGIVPHRAHIPSSLGR